MRPLSDCTGLKLSHIRSGCLPKSDFSFLNFSSWKTKCKTRDYDPYLFPLIHVCANEVSSF